MRRRCTMHGNEHAPHARAHSCIALLTRRRIFSVKFRPPGHMMHVHESRSDIQDTSRKLLLWIWQLGVVQHTHFCPNIIKTKKIYQCQKYRGIVIYHMDNILIVVLKINLIGLLRYGNPDIQFLATLKNKILIYNILSILMMNLISNLISCTFFKFLLEN